MNMDDVDLSTSQSGWCRHQPGMIANNMMGNNMMGNSLLFIKLLIIKRDKNIENYQI